MTSFLGEVAVRWNTTWAHCKRCSKVSWWSCTLRNQVYFLSPEVLWVWTGGGSVEGGNDFFRVSKVQSAHAQQAGAQLGAMLAQTSNVVLLCARQEQQWMAREHIREDRIDLKSSSQEYHYIPVLKLDHRCLVSSNKLNSAHFLFKCVIQTTTTCSRLLDVRRWYLIVVRKKYILSRSEIEKCCRNEVST